LLKDWAGHLNSEYDNVLFLGNDVSLHKEVIIEQLGEKVHFGEFCDHNPRPSELARLGMKREPNDDIHTFTPNYIRLAEAETNWLADQKNKA
jgi:tRNA threonylcarbamoyladenosine biosynthesis protein TsaB